MLVPGTKLFHTWIRIKSNYHLKRNGNKTCVRANACICAASANRTICTVNGRIEWRQMTGMRNANARSCLCVNANSSLVRPAWLNDNDGGSCLVNLNCLPYMHTSNKTGGAMCTIFRRMHRPFRAHTSANERLCDWLQEASSRRVRKKKQQQTCNIDMEEARVGACSTATRKYTISHARQMEIEFLH